MATEAGAVGLRRGAALIAAFGLAFSATGWAVLETLDHAGVGRPGTALDRVAGLRLAIRSAGQRSAPGGNVVIVGDSHLLRSGELPMHSWIERGLWQEHPDAMVSRLAAPGLSQFAHYSIADRIVSLAPAAVVVELNLAGFSTQWRDASDAHFAALLAPGRWPEAMLLPLEWAGLRLDQLLLYGSIVHAGGLQRWRWLQGEQARWVLGARVLGDALQERSPWPEGARYLRQFQIARAQRERQPDRRRASREFARTTLGPVLEGAPPDHPALRFLDAALARYAEAGIPVLVFVNPVNLEHLRALGVPMQGLPATLARAEQVARGRGAGFVDLHALLPDPAFGDEMDHLDPDAGGSRRLGTAVAEALLALPALRGSGAESAGS